MASLGAGVGFAYLVDPLSAEPDSPCRFCRARFEVAVRGYCTYCHAVVQADENGRCQRCKNGVIDRQVESKLLGA